MKDQSATVNPERQRSIAELADRFSEAGIRRRRLKRVYSGNAWLLWIHLLTAVKRAMDLAIALTLLALCLPILLCTYLIAKSRGQGVVRTVRLGRWGCTFQQFSFGAGPLRGLPALFNVIAGDMSLIGPRAVSPQDIPAEDRLAWRRFNVRPGLVGIWWIRERANIAWGNESEADSEYVDTLSVWNDLAIGLRAIPAALYGQGVALAPDRITLLGITFDNLTMAEAIEQIVQRARADRPSQLCFVNADCVNIACRDAEYRATLNRADLVLADGIGLKLAGRILNNNIRQNVNGTDLFPQLCAALEHTGIGLYLLGGKPGVPDEVARWIAGHHPGVAVRGFHHGYFTTAEAPQVVDEIRRSGAQILLVAFGVPKQEKWIRENQLSSGVSLALGVGGLFDFYSGRIPRAPQWVREIGAEWLYRFLQEPRRMWRRYFVGNFVFLMRVFSERAGVTEWSRS